MFVRDGKVGPKQEKDPVSPDLEGEFLQFVPDTLEQPLYTFLMTNLLLLSQKLTTKLFLDQFQTVPFTLSLSFPKLWAKFVILLHPPISFDVNLDWPKFRFHSLCRSKVIEEKALEGSVRHLVSEGLRMKFMPIKSYREKPWGGGGEGVQFDPWYLKG